MRNLGGILLVGGIFGFFYCGSRLSEVEPVPEETGIAQSLEYPAGRLEVARAAGAAAAVMGVALLLIPTGR